MITSADYEHNVFINCPFDDHYVPMFNAIVFAVHALGFRARSGRERENSGEVRINTIAELIQESRYSIHDLSRTELDAVHALPHFNMPLELGIDLGCRRFSPHHNDKSMLILDTERYRHQKYISDIAGQDIVEHNGDPEIVIRQVRRWLSANSHVPLRSAKDIYARYQQFLSDLPVICKRLKLDANDLSFNDFTYTISKWLEAHRDTAQ